MTKLFRAALAAAACAGAMQATGCVSTKSSCADGGCGAAGGRGNSLLGDASLQDRYNACVDPCWPERYTYVARQEVISPFANQVANGRAIDQTIFNGDFEQGTDKLTPGGLQKLDTIARRRPVNGQVFVQTSRDIAYDAANREQFAKTKADLDAKRADAVQGYLAASTGGRKLNFEVAITDPQDMTLPVIGPALSIRGYAFQFQSGLRGLAGNGFAGGIGGQNFTSAVTGGTFGAAGGNVGPNNASAAGLGAPPSGNAGVGTAGGGR